MRSSDVLIDIGWALERDDLESIAFVDKVRHDAIASAFDGKGPLRIVTKASIAHRGVGCSSLEDERVLQDASKLVPYLRHAYVMTLEIDCSCLDPETTRKLLKLKDSFVIDTLELSSNALYLIDGALECTTLIWQSRNYKQGRRKVEQDYGYEDYDEDEIKEHEERFAFLEDFFKLRTVRNAKNVDLEQLPYIHLKAVSRWLHGDDADQRLSGSKELHVWSDVCQGNELNALIARFFSDTEPREYKLFVAGESVGVSAYRMQSRKLENNAGDVFEVEISVSCSSSVTVTRYGAANAKRTSLVQSMDGPKVWDFRTAHELERYLLGNSVYELLARSGLIGNEIICRCGSRMHLRIMRRSWDCKGATWHCVGNCKIGYVFPTFRSWFWNFGHDHYGNLATILKLVILLVSDGHNADSAAKLEGSAYWKKLLEQRDELLQHEDRAIEDPIERFYTAVLRKYPCEGPVVLPV